MEHTTRYSASTESKLKALQLLKNFCFSFSHTFLHFVNTYPSFLECFSFRSHFDLSVWLLILVHYQQQGNRYGFIYKSKSNFTHMGDSALRKSHQKTQILVLLSTLPRLPLHRRTHPRHDRRSKSNSPETLSNSPAPANPRNAEKFVFPALLYCTSPNAALHLIKHCYTTIISESLQKPKTQEPKTK